MRNPIVFSISTLDISLLFKNTGKSIGVVRGFIELVEITIGLVIDTDTYRPALTCLRFHDTLETARKRLSMQNLMYE